MDEDEFVLNLLLQEEGARLNGQQGGQAPPDDADDAYGGKYPENAKQSIVMERTGFDAASAFVIGDNQYTFPISGVGCLETILLITDSQDYTITVEVDAVSDTVGGGTTTFVDEDYSTLKEISTEIDSVAAYEDNEGQDVLAIGPVNFIDNVRAWVQPNSSVHFYRQRAEVTLNRTRG